MGVEAGDSLEIIEIIGEQRRGAGRSVCGRQTCLMLPAGAPSPFFDAFPPQRVAGIPRSGRTTLIRLKKEPYGRPEFHRQADAAISDLYNKLAAATDDFEFDVDMNAGALAIEFEEPPGKFVVSPNTPVRQIWVSALTRSFKVDWEPRAPPSSVLKQARPSTTHRRRHRSGSRRRSPALRQVPGVYISYPFCSQKCTLLQLRLRCAAARVGRALPAALQGRTRCARLAVAPGDRLSRRRHAQPAWTRPPSPPARASPAVRGAKPLSKPRPAASPWNAPRAWREAGINRVSLGVQSLRRRERSRRTGRKHNAGDRGRRRRDSCARPAS